MAEKHKLHNIRLDDEVWAAVKAMDCSLNQYLRSVLLSSGGHMMPCEVEITEFSPPTASIPVVDNRPKNAYCKHCGSRFAGTKFATICQNCKSSGHTNQPAECPRCTEASAI